MSISKYISNGLVGYSIGLLAQRFAKKYFVKNYGFTDEDFELLEKGLKTFDEILETKPIL